MNIKLKNVIMYVFFVTLGIVEIFSFYTLWGIIWGLVLFFPYLIHSWYSKHFSDGLIGDSTSLYLIGVIYGVILVWLKPYTKLWNFLEEIRINSEQWFNKKLQHYHP